MVTQREVELVQADWAKVAQISDTAATLFYDRLFTLDSQLRPLFSPDLTEQKLKLMQMIGLAVKGLSRPNELLPAVQALGQRHVGYGVKPEHYDTVGAALLWTLKQGLGPDFDAERESAWGKVYQLLAETMIAASQQPAATA